MNEQIRSLLNSDKVILHIDTNDPKILHSLLMNLGFQDKFSKNGFGGGGRETPHNEWVNYQPLDKSYPILVHGEKTYFEPCYELWATCYSRVDDCSVGEEIARKLLDNNLKVAVFDYDSLETRALLIDII
ncbi:MAG: hypothetical protein AABX39_02210 [Nanoarchaeota archaeon]